MAHLKAGLALFLTLLVLCQASCSNAQSSLKKAVAALESEIATEWEAVYKKEYPDRARSGYHSKFQIVDIRISSSNSDVAQVGVDRWAEDDFGQRLHMTQGLPLSDVEQIHFWQQTNGKWQPVRSGPDHLYFGSCIYERPWREWK